MLENIILKFLPTCICLGIIFVWFLYAKQKFKKYVDENPFGDYEQPRTASILGVLGTFIGVTIGLLNFDPSPEEIQKSVIHLLGGMTTAFFTSIVGMSISLYLRNYQSNVQKNFYQQNPGISEANISDLIQYLKISDEKKTSLLKKLANVLTDDNESTIIGQMKITRLDLRDNFKNLEKKLQDNNELVITELKNFGKTLSENSSKILIEALNETVKDFNNKLTEQFGENFKQLNVAVGKLLMWQENYRLTLENVTKNLQITFDGINAVKKSLHEIEKSAESMTESSQQIQDLIVTANFYENKLNQVLQEIQTLGENSREAISNAINFIQTLCEETKLYTEQATQDLNSHISSTTDSLNENLQGTLSRTNTMTTSITEFIQTLCEETKLYTEQATQDLNSHISSTTNNLNENLQNTLIKTNNMTAAINGFGNTALNKISNTTEETIASMQKMSTELRQESFKITSETAAKMIEMMNANDRNFKDSLETLGKAMIQISKKFAEDYEPLANELKKIVEISKQVQRSGRGGLF